MGDNVATPTYEKMFNNGLVANAVRGQHSTGIISAKEGEQSYYKNAVNGSSLITDPNYVKWLQKQTKVKAYMGHNRHATMGSLGVEGAHPFVHGDITLCHNGTLVGWSHLPDALSFDIDSEYLVYYINKVGIDTAVSEIDGAWALSYVDAASNTINFCRNDERPLYFGRLRVKTGKKMAVNTWVYGSEKGMLKWIVERNGMEVVNFFELKPEKLLSFDIYSDMSSFEVRDLEYTEYNECAWMKHVPNYYSSPKSKHIPINSNKVTNIKEGTPSPKVVGDLSRGDRVSFWPSHFVHLGGAYSQGTGTLHGVMTDDPWHAVRVNYIQDSLLGELSYDKAAGGHILMEGRVMTAAVVAHTNKNNPEEGTLILSGDGVRDEEELVAGFTGMVKGPSGFYITEAEWLCLVKDGCFVCDETLTLKDVDEVVWSEGLCLCPDCAVTFDEYLEDVL